MVKPVEPDESPVNTIHAIVYTHTSPPAENAERDRLPPRIEDGHRSDCAERNVVPISARDYHGRGQRIRIICRQHRFWGNGFLIDWKLSTKFAVFPVSRRSLANRRLGGTPQ